MASSRENKNAYRKPSTLKPLTNQSASIIMMAFITSKNNPRDNMVTGSVSNINIGLTIKFNIDMDKATSIALT